MRQPSPDPQAGNNAARRQSGSVLVYLVVGLVTFGVLALAGVSRFSSTVRGVISPNCATSARYMGESGMRYALAKLRTYTDEAALIAAVATLNGQTITVDAGKGLSFTLAVTYNTGTKTASVTSTGTSCSNFLAVTNAVTNGSVNLPALNVTPSGVSVSFANDIGSFSATSDLSAGGAASVSVNTTAKTVTFGNSGYTDAGAFWYAGNNTLCVEGNCTMGSGVCAYWEHVFNSSSQGDGYVWTIMSGDTNTKTSFGGHVNMGELMGYGGPGTSGRGVQPPKLGMEFDIYYNSCGSSFCSSGSRCDPSSSDHVAFIFWGSNTVSGCTSNTYDDNAHGSGAGNASEPVNSYNFTGNGDGWDGFYVRPGGNASWMKGGSRGYIRYELNRPTTANSEGNYVYTERSWLYTAADTRPTTLSNCTATMTAQPSMVRTFALTPALHSKLAKAFFGWTEGTGGATQVVTLSNFVLNFKDPPAAPTTPVPPAGYVAAWNFSEAQGSTTRDLSGNGHTMTGANFAMWGPDVRAYDNASVLMAGSGFATTPHKADLVLNTGTISAWIKLNSYAQAGGIVHKGATTDDEDYSLQLNMTLNSGILTFQMHNTWGTQFILDSAAGALPTGVWTHVAVTWTTSMVKLYVNGSMIAQKAVPNGWSVRNSGGPLLIGAQNNHNGWPEYTYRGFDGLIDDVYIYNTALNQSNITALSAGHP